MELMPWSVTPCLGTSCRVMPCSVMSCACDVDVAVDVDVDVDVAPL